MNIIGLSQANSGCGYHRVLLPLGFMKDVKAHVTNFITEDKIEGIDIMLYNRRCIYDANFDEFRRITGSKVVMDIDDYWLLPPNHLLYGEYNKSRYQIENNIRNADMVTVTNEELRKRVYPLNNNVHVFENAIPFGHNQFTDERREDDRIRIFWSGSITHEHDVKMLRGPVQRLLPYADKIKMVIGGYTDESPLAREIWGRIFSAFTAGGKLPYAKIHGTSPVQYMQLYENADIMVIPLEDSDWHACKSNLKILEAASKRIPVIVSNVRPYNVDKDAPVFWVNSQKDWFFHLKYLILNPEARIEYGNKLYDWAKRHYNLEDINTRRREAFANLCGASAHPRVLSEDGRVGELSPSHTDGVADSVPCVV